MRQIKVAACFVETASSVRFALAAARPEQRCSPAQRSVYSRRADDFLGTGQFYDKRLVVVVRPDVRAAERSVILINKVAFANRADACAQPSSTLARRMAAANVALE